jgi:transcriptional regulator with XRE-family HTH domain
MSSLLADYFRTERKCQRLTLGQLAARVGYGKTVSKGCRRLCRFERDGTIKPDLLEKVAEALGIDWNIVERLLDEDRQERLQAFEQWVRVPVPMRLVVRLMPGVYCNKAVPSEITTAEDAQKWACDWAYKHHKQVCLVLSRRWSTWIDACGCVTSRTEAKPGEPNAPFMWLGHRRFLLDDNQCSEIGL